MDRQQLIARIEQIYAQLDEYTYYQLLNLAQNTAPDEIRRAYHRMALSLHPDRHANERDAQLKDKVSTIYKRIAEGYRVLMDHQKRQEYDTLLTQGSKRLVKAERPRVGPTRPEMAIDNPQARKFFLLAQNAQHSGDTKGARLNYKLAMGLVGEHPLIMERLAALDAESEKTPG